MSLGPGRPKEGSTCASGGGRLREHAGDVIERGRDAVGSQREQLAAALEAGRRAYQEATAESDARIV